MSSPSGNQHGTSLIKAAAAALKPPRAKPNARTFVVHGNEHRDHYAYLADPALPQTRRYIKAESKHFNDSLSAVSVQRSALYGELKARIFEEAMSVPEVFGGYRYYTRVEAGRQYPIHCRIADDDRGEEEVYLDENVLAGDSAYCDVSVVTVCPAHKSVACSVDRTGEEMYEILIASMEEGVYRRCAGSAGDSIAWSRDGLVLLYTRTDDNARPDSVWAYDTTRDEHHCLIDEPDGAFHVSVWLTRSRDWLLVDIGSNTCSETRVLPADDPFATPVTVLPRREDIEYSVEHHEGRFLVLINDVHDNFRLVELSLPLSGNGAHELVELIPPDENKSLEYVDAYRGHLVIGERAGGVEQTLVWDLDSGQRRHLPGHDPLSSVELEDLYDYDAAYIRYEHSTPIEPSRVYDYDVATGISTLRKTWLPSGYDPAEYASERRLVDSDGVGVPLTLIYRREASGACPRNAPVLITGYGAYEQAVDLGFDADLVSLLDRGVVVAHTHVRGGGDLGPAWHDAGRLADKENSFADFIACARYLLDNGIAARGGLAAWGASAGGLLVAVALNRHPELFGSAVLEVPFVDALNTLLDPALPLTEHDFDEFGDPSDPHEYRWIRAYSPYDNIRSQAYPPALVTAAMNDQRVGYWEALKWTARLRAFKTDDNPVLLRMDNAGHLGESGRYGAVKETAIVYTFLLDMWGLLPEAGAETG